ncbi:MAG TPA: RNA 2',3'-cyclic phosphodiesterase, partial [Gemmatimonadaceae bacterium]|nr:RNA 2',3'-cyclic phosphodiesterase [Gemmatimonadaceae bacterium]
RIFLAINPPAEVRRRIWDATVALREAHRGVAWVAEPKIHLTLKFLGVVPEAAVDPLSDAMVEVARTHAPPLVHLQTVGAFPDLRRPRVVWLGVDPEPRLELLHHDVEVACERIGHELDGRPYRPHLTLGRVREAGTADVIKALRMAARRVRFSDEFHVQSIDVMQSVPGSAGSTYTVLASAPMKGS